jgi:hypothetical protein
MTLRVVRKLVMFLVRWLPARLDDGGLVGENRRRGLLGRTVALATRSVMGEAAEGGSPPTPEAPAFQGVEINLHRVTSAAVA